MREKLQKNDWGVALRQTLCPLRYPGGKRRFIARFAERLTAAGPLNGTYYEPFVGGGAVFFALHPKCAVLSDINRELIDLYRGIRLDPGEVWRRYQAFPSSKEGYYAVRDAPKREHGCVPLAARLLYLNRTCFRGMWRHNTRGEFNVGYGGQDRRWVISAAVLRQAASALDRAKLRCLDFEEVIDGATADDFLLCDPPYSAGETAPVHRHYQVGEFGLTQQGRLAAALKRADRRGVRWLLLDSSHRAITNLYQGFNVAILGAGKTQTARNGEIVITNYE